MDLSKGVCDEMRYKYSRCQTACFIQPEEKTDSPELVHEIISNKYHAYVSVLQTIHGG